MKKDKPQSPLKAAKKKIKDDLHQKLGKVLQSIANELGKDGSKLDLDINKESKKLAKKFVKNLTLDHNVTEQSAKVVTTEIPVKEVKAPIAQTAKKPVAAKPVAKNGIAKTPPAKQIKK